MDHRQLNDATVKDAYPLPRIDDTLDMLAGKQWFSTLDLASGYWQVSLSQDARAKTAFATHSGLFQFRVMPFGLCNAPATFERLMDRVLQGLRWSRCLVYLDDIISFGGTFGAALSNLTLIREIAFVWFTTEVKQVPFISRVCPLSGSYRRTTGSGV